MSNHQSQISNIQSQISNLQSQLESVYPKDEAEALAWWIVEELSGLSRTQLQIGCKDTTIFANMQKIHEIVERLLHFEPIQYIFGHTLWCGLDLKVTPATLIPRPETAELVEKINQMVNDQMVNDQMVNVLDIGTGSGCIALALKKAHPEWQVTGIDISPEAIEIARENAKRNGVEVEFQVVDIFSDQMTKYLNKWYMVNDPMVNIVVSNPPYVCESEKVSMNSNVLDYEPHTALFVPDTDPLRFYRRIAELFANLQSSIFNLQSSIANLQSSIFNLQSPDGVPDKRGNPRRKGHQRPLYLFFEINEHFPDEIETLLHSLGYQNIRIHRDIYGKPRIAEAVFCLDV